MNQSFPQCRIQQQQQHEDFDKRPCWLSWQVEFYQRQQQQLIEIVISNLHSLSQDFRQEFCQERKVPLVKVCEARLSDSSSSKVDYSWKIIRKQSMPTQTDERRQVCISTIKSHTRANEWKNTFWATNIRSKVPWQPKYTTNKHSPRGARKLVHELWRIVLARCP